ncbi:hypothetical protein D9M69_340180 [compost metagenome]
MYFDIVYKSTIVVVLAPEDESHPDFPMVIETHEFIQIFRDMIREMVDHIEEPSCETLSQIRPGTTVYQHDKISSDHLIVTTRVYSRRCFTHRRDFHPVVGWILLFTVIRRMHYDWPCACVFLKGTLQTVLTEQIVRQRTEHMTYTNQVTSVTRFLTALVVEQGMHHEVLDTNVVYQNRVVLTIEGDWCTRDSNEHPVLFDFERDVAHDRRYSELLAGDIQHTGLADIRQVHVHRRKITPFVAEEILHEIHTALRNVERPGVAGTRTRDYVVHFQRTAAFASYIFKPSRVLRLTATDDIVDIFLGIRHVFACNAAYYILIENRRVTIMAEFE